MDLDHFKVLNDTLGHPVGDDILRQVAERLTGVVRAGDTVGRLGGEEFAVLLQGADSRVALEIIEVARASIRRISLPSLNVDCSAEVAAAQADGTDSERILELADVALYEAKRAGRGRALCFDRAGTASSPRPSSVLRSTTCSTTPRGSCRSSSRSWSWPPAASSVTRRSRASTRP